jgi:hypothetical protein
MPVYVLYRGKGYMRETVVEAAIKAYLVALPLYEFASAVAVFVLIPLAVWRKTRHVAGVGLLITSYVFGITLWFLSAAIAFGAFGWFGLIVGLLFFGVGVVPLAILGAFFKLKNSLVAMVLLFMVLSTLGARVGGMYTVSKSKE